MTIRSRVLVAGTLSMLLAVAAPLSGGARPAKGCADRVDAGIATAGKIGIPGLYALPKKAPATLVVFDHGYRKPGTAYWDGHLRDAANHGVIGVAPYYTGIGPAPDYRGWDVHAGAEDSLSP